jgi:SET domain-containing protein
MEVLTEESCQERLRTMAHAKNFYMSKNLNDSNKPNDLIPLRLTLSASEYIDASRKGGTCRFMNHSCSPNCETQKWLVDGLLRVGIFAKKDLPSQTELTFDYKFERFGAARQTCYCGSLNCRGFLGAKPKSKSKAAKRSTLGASSGSRICSIPYTSVKLDN